MLPGVCSGGTANIGSACALCLIIVLSARNAARFHCALLLQIEEFEDLGVKNSHHTGGTLPYLAWTMIEMVRCDRSKQEKAPDNYLRDGESVSRPFWRLNTLAMPYAVGAVETEGLSRSHSRYLKPYTQPLLLCPGRLSILPAA